MQTPEQETTWLAALPPPQALHALALMTHLVTINARAEYQTTPPTDHLFAPSHFNERAHRLTGFILHTSRGHWTASMAEAARAEIDALPGFGPDAHGSRQTLMQWVREHVERPRPT